MLTLAALKMSFTDCEISGPMPSPSIKVTVNFPYKPMVKRCLSHPFCMLGEAWNWTHIGPLLSFKFGDLV